MTDKSYKSTHRRTEQIMEIVQQHYEPHRHDRCLSYIWRMYIHPIMGLSESGFRKYLARANFRVQQPRKPATTEQSDRQMILPIWVLDDDNDDKEV